MTAKSIIGTVLGFLSHHISDLNNVASALNAINNSLPIDAQDKERIAKAIAAVEESATNIETFLSSTTVTGDNGTVTVKESDIESSLATFLTSNTGKALLHEAVQVAGVAAPSSTEGNGNV